MLYSVWQVSPGAGGEIHYQRRTPLGHPVPRDTTLDALGDALQNPRIALDGAPATGRPALRNPVSDGMATYVRIAPKTAPTLIFLPPR